MRQNLLIGLLLFGAMSADASAGVREDRLLQAIRGDDHATIKALLAQHANPNTQLPDKSTPLAWAVNRQDEESVRLLLKAGGKPNVPDVDGASPFLLACELGDPAIVVDLLKAGADAKAARPDGISALALCATTSTPAVLENLIAKGADVNAADLDGQTPLMRAAAKGDTDIMAVLIKHGANVNAATKKGFTPLIFALKSKVPAASAMLADAGADTKTDLPDGTSMIQAAIMEHNIPFAMRLVAALDDMSQTDKRGRQLIHVAALSGSADLVKLVLSKGGDPNALTPQAKLVMVSVLDHSAGLNESGVARVIKKVPTVPALPACSAPPLLLAAAAGSAPAMRALIEAGARTDAKAQDGSTLALAAAAGGNLEALKYALELDPDVDAKTLDGRSMIHVVIEHEYGADDQAMIQYLVDRGAKLEQLDNAGHTPGFVVNQRGPAPLRVMYIQLLKDHGLVSPFP
jgi:ankyrin repeat protein